METNAPSAIDMVFLYYDNPDMLSVQIDCWNTYPAKLRFPPAIILIDDGSPRTQAVNIVKKCRCKLPIRVFRIHEDIKWNFTGARNLGCHHAKNWIYMSDIDTVLTADDAKKFFEDQPLNKNCIYKPQTRYFPDLPCGFPGNVNLLYHKESYLEVCGYDEDYAGNYGRGDTDFYNRIKNAFTKITRDDVWVRVVTVNQVSDACTLNQTRDKSTNVALHESKQKAGLNRPKNPLRFTWKQVL